MTFDVRRVFAAFGALLTGVVLGQPAVAQTQEPVADTSGYGGATSGSSQAGGMVQLMSGPKSVYFGN